MDDFSDLKSTAEAIAYRLFRDIMELEGRVPSSERSADRRPTNRKTALDLFAECMEAVRGERGWKTSGRI